MKSLMKGLLSGLTLLGLSAAPALAEYPEKPIEIIVGYSAGGGTDVLARTVGGYLEKALGGEASVVVKNMPGAGGQIGFTAVAQAKPDGYTLGTFNLPAALALTLDREADYDADSFTYLANFVKDPNTIVVSKETGIESLKDLLDRAAKEPGRVTMGLSALGGNDHFAGILMESAAGVDVSFVPFKGAANARAAIMGGHVMAGTMTLGQTVGYEDNLRVLAVLDSERSPFAPDVPTAKELGYDVEMGSYRGLVAPAGLPEAVREKLLTALRAVNDNPEFQKTMVEQGNPASFVAGDDFAALAGKQASVAAKIWNATPWK
ncbi:tripartite tricarboxylate transporter substrate binding protein [Rhodospirillum sp. A1_3_36]|uniref:tripartite tricarboxylate transporter substrate binding protein n=1 Tax=Rhodospirillum sp. A1_3_36 TaxID=3391666 RepID=UPI0039A7234E